MTPAQFLRGERKRLSLYSSAKQLQVEVGVDPGLVRGEIDLCCFVIDGDRKLRDDRYLIFYNQLVAPDDSVRQERPGPNRAVFHIDLARLPSWTERLAFTATVDGSGTMADVRAGGLWVKDFKGPLIHYPFQGADFDREQALVVGELYLHGGEWRFAAVGQGFGGDLATLIAYYGGEIAGAPAPPSAPPFSPSTYPSLPSSSPPISAPPAGNVAQSELQRMLDGAPAGSTVSLGAGEYEGPAVLSKPLVLAGSNATIWARSGPVLRVAHPGVILQGLSIEATAPAAGRVDADVALAAEAGCEPQLQNVRIRGRVSGITSEDGRWALPQAVQLGSFAPGHKHTFRLRLAVPVQCRIESKVSGVRLVPEVLGPGPNEVTLHVDGVPADTLIVGDIEVRSGRFCRPFALTGSTIGQKNSLPVREKLLWEPGA
jgi:stress response protein SCP2